MVWKLNLENLYANMAVYRASLQNMQSTHMFMNYAESIHYCACGR